MMAVSLCKPLDCTYRGQAPRQRRALPYPHLCVLTDADRLASHCRNLLIPL